MILWSKVVVPALNILGLLGSLLGIAIGILLVVDSARAQRLFATMNRWVSSRRAMKALEVPRGAGASARAGRRGLGALLLAGGAYSAGALLFTMNSAKTVAALGIKGSAVLAFIVVESLRWFMIAGGLAAMVFGVLMLLLPRTWESLEAKANRWYSTRRALTGGDEMRFPLDRWVARRPRRNGFIIGGASLVAAACYVFLLLR